MTNEMATESFLKSYEVAKRRNKLPTYEEKLEVWSHDIRDWDNGQVDKDGKPLWTSYVPFEAAVEIHKSKARYLIIAAGNRFSKSLIAAEEAIVMMTIPLTHIWIVGPTYKIIDSGEWPYIEHALTKTGVWFDIIKPKIQAELDKIGSRDKPESHIRVLRNSPKTIEIDYPLSGKSIIEQQSYKNISGVSGEDALKMEGAKLSMIIFAEGSRVPRLLWEKHLKRRLADKYGRVIIPATPKGKDEFLFRAYKRGQTYDLTIDIDFRRKRVIPKKKPVKPGKWHVTRAKSYGESYETFHYPAYVNPYFNMDEYNNDVLALFETRKENKLDPSTFRERNFGTFESMAGRFYREIDFSKILVKSTDYPIPEGSVHYRCIDPGRVGAAACLWIAVAPPNEETGISKVIVYDELYETGLWAKTLTERILEKDKHEILYSACDRAVTKDTDASEKSVEKQLIEYGIDPLYVPQRTSTPHRVIDKLNGWKHLLTRHIMVVYKDICINFVREMLDLEYDDPVYKKGKTILTEVLNPTCDKHALDSFGYGFYCGTTKYRSPQKEEVVATVIEQTSFAAALDNHRKRTANKSLNLIGSF